MQRVRREIASYSLGTLVTLQHTLYMYHRKQSYENKNIIFNDKPTSLHTLYSSYKH
jgi:hypothetical protein